MIKNICGENNIIDFNGTEDKNISISITGNNNKIIVKTIDINNCEFNIYGDNHNIIIEDGSIINNIKVFVKSSDSIHSSDSVFIIENDAVVRDCQVFLQGDKTKVSIGEKTTILGCIFFAIECNSEINIGKDCMLSWGIEIRTSDWHSIYDIETNERINSQKSVNIKDHVWVGSHATILKGIDVENDSIIGSHSIVTKSVPSNSIVAGNPAKLIRNNVRWSRENNEHCTN